MTISLAKRCDLMLRMFNAACRLSAIRACQIGVKWELTVRFSFIMAEQFKHGLGPHYRLLLRRLIRATEHMPSSKAALLGMHWVRHIMYLEQRKWMEAHQ